MSRTIKDMPYEVQMHDALGLKCPADYSNLHPTWEMDIPKSIWFTIGWDGQGIVGRFAKSANRRYKAKCKEFMRHEDYDNMPIMKRCARWDAY